MNKEKSETLAVRASLVKELREKTGAGMMACKQALQESEGKMEKAIQSLRQKGLASAAKKAERKAQEGLIESYIHTGGKLGVLLELNCETDFVARRSDFQALAKNLAMQVAASPSVHYVSMEAVPLEMVEKERVIEGGKEDLSQKPPLIAQKIVEGRVEKLFKSQSLLDQSFLRDPQKTVEEVIQESISKTGENIKVARFIRFQLGEKD